MKEDFYIYRYLTNTILLDRFNKCKKYYAFSLKKNEKDFVNRIR